MSELPETKRCSTCKEVKLKSSFSPAAKGRSRCKSCTAVKSLARYHAKKLEPGWVAMNNARALRNYYARQAGAPTPRPKAARTTTPREKQAWIRYGLSPEALHALDDRHGGMCAICHQACPLRPQLTIDHCHATGKVRGLLCDACNKGLGAFKDNQERLSRAIDYLKMSG